MTGKNEAKRDCGCGGHGQAQAAHTCCGANKCQTRRALCELERGECAVVDKVEASGSLGCRLRQMGLVAGAPIRFCKRAPLGDPIEIKLKHTHLMLRRAEAGCVIVTTETGGADND